MKKLTLVTIFIFSLIALNVFALDMKNLSPISVSDAVVYVPFGKSKATTAFFTIKNNSKETVTIVKVTSEYIKTINLVPSIVAIKKSSSASTSSTAAITPNPWTLVPGQLLKLTPNHQYLQLNDLKTLLTTGDELQLEMNLSNGKKVIIIARAKSAYDQIHGN